MPYLVLDAAEAQPFTPDTVGAPLVEGTRGFAVMQEELRLKLRGRDDVSGRLAGWVNDAYADLCSSLQLDEHRISIGLTLAVGTPLYMLPEAVDTVLGVTLLYESGGSALRNGWPLDKIDLAYYRELDEEDGNPEKFFRYGQMLVLWPTPTVAKSLVVDARITPLPLEADGDVPLLPRYWREGIVLLAKQKALAELGEHEEAILAQNDYTDFVRRREDREANEDERRLVLSSVPSRISELRNRELKGVQRFDGLR